MRCGRTDEHGVHDWEGVTGRIRQCPGYYPDLGPVKSPGPVDGDLVRLQTWWADNARREADGVLPKALEYGSNSLIAVGRMIARLQGREVGDEEATELGCWFYTFSKIERWTDAVLRGERPSDDTIHDPRVYLGMAQRNRAVGGWPNAPKEEQ